MAYMKKYRSLKARLRDCPILGTYKNILFKVKCSILPIKKKKKTLKMIAKQ